MRKEKKIAKTVQRYFSSVISGIKSQIPNFHKSTAMKVFHGCKRPKRLPFSTAATLDDVDRFLYENFRSLYGENEVDDGESKEEVMEFDDPRNLVEMSTVTDVCGSSRFFVSPVASRSLIEEARTKTSQLKFNVGDCVAVASVSECPYEDFKRSMVEVTKARSKHGRMIDWDFMEELLFCYLRMNEKHNHRFVLRAFVDLVVDLRRSDDVDRNGELVSAEWGRESSLKYFG